MHRSVRNFNIPRATPGHLTKPFSHAQSGKLTLGSVWGMGIWTKERYILVWRDFEHTRTKLCDFVYIKLFLKVKNGVLVHVIQYSLVSRVLMEVFRSTLIYILKTKLSREWKEQLVNFKNKEISTNVFTECLFGRIFAWLHMIYVVELSWKLPAFIHRKRKFQSNEDFVVNRISRASAARTR